MTPNEVELMAEILRRCVSPMWWARLAYPTDPKFWTEAERHVLNLAGLTGRRGV